MKTKETIKVLLCTMPVEGAGQVLNRKRSDGPVGIVPKVAIVGLIKEMQKNGFPASSYDFYDIDMLYPDDAELEEFLQSCKPDVIGLSAPVSTSYAQVKRVSSMARAIFPDVWIVMGGHLSASAELILNKTEVDLVICGDGEIAWIETLEHILKFPDRNCFKIKDKFIEINGVAFLDNNGAIKLNGFGIPLKGEDISYPDYDILKLGVKNDPSLIWNYFRPGLSAGLFNFDERANDEGRGMYMASLFTSKGCTNRCTFCQRGTKSFRVMSLEKLEDHIIYLKENFDVGFIKILDESFGTNKKHAYKVADIMDKHGMLWFALGRCKSMDEEDIAYYKSKGCSAIQFGIESGSQRMLDLMEKRFKVEDVLATLTSCIKNGVYSPVSILLGMPGEDESTALETGRFLGLVAAAMGVHPQVINFDLFYAMPNQGSPLWEYGQINGVLPDDSDLDGSDSFMQKYSYITFYKRYYINLNGAATKELLFWEYLVRLEASRVFMQRNKSVVQKVGGGVMEEFYKEHGTYKRGGGITEIYNEKNKKNKAINPRMSLRYKSVKFITISYIIDKYFVENSFINRVPRFIVYPLIKNLLYLEFLVQRMYRQNREFTIFQKNKKINRIKLECGKVESLRDIVIKNEKPVDQMTTIERTRHRLNVGVISGAKY